MEDYNNPNEGVNQTQYISSSPEQKSNKKIWLLILIPVFIILIVVIIFLFMSSSTKTCSDYSGRICNEGESCKGELKFADIYGNNSYVEKCCIGTCFSDTGDKCNLIKTETGVNFPCKYFVPVNELPNEYNIHIDNSGNYGLYEVPQNDISLGPREGVNYWYSLVYSKGDVSTFGPEGIHGFSLNILNFKQGYNKTQNIEKIELINEQIQESGLAEVQYLVNGDDLLVIIPFVDSTDSEVNEFKNKLSQLF